MPVSYHRSLCLIYKSGWGWNLHTVNTFYKYPYGDDKKKEDNDEIELTFRFLTVITHVSI